VTKRLKSTPRAEGAAQKRQLADAPASHLQGAGADTNRAAPPHDGRGDSAVERIFRDFK